MIVELEPGVWLCDGEGDPPRTTIKNNAKKFPNVKEAVSALIAARKYRPFKNALLVSEN
jgi:hypothetical protein